MTIGPTELLYLLLYFLPALIVGFVLWRVIKSNNIKRISELESRVERLERQLDRPAEPTAPKEGAAK
ncbi:MAG: hypothetical protein L0220_26035 [Acidobacteria bacterium]|nr:hypothetical protein [Acidobacteriota bacterium]